MESASSAYQRMVMRKEEYSKQANALSQSVLKDAKDKQISFGEAKKQRAMEFANLFRPWDVQALSELLDSGYSLREVKMSYHKQNYFAQVFDDAQFIKYFEDSVWDNVNDARQKRSHEELEPAKKAYATYQSALKGQYEEEDDAEYREGQILLHMIVQDGYTEQTVEDVLATEAKYDPAEIEKLMETCGHVKQAYLDIARAKPLEEARNQFDIYRFFAKSYMERTNIKLLTFEDEMALIRTLKEIKFPKNLLESAILKASPVAKEAGRNPEAYVKALLSGDFMQEPKTRKGKNILSAENVYQGYIKEKNIDEADDKRPIYDCLAVVSLLEKHYSEEEIQKTINDNSGKQAGKYPNYARWLLEKAKKILQKKQELLQKNLPKLAKGVAFATLGVTAGVLFAVLLRERLELNPSLEQNLFTADLDRDITETALQRYPDIDREALAGVLQNTPRAILFSGTNLAEGKDYAENVLKTVETRIQEQQKQQEEQKARQKELQQQHSAVRQGLAEEKALSVYDSGLIALRMLQKGYDDMEIRDSLMNANMRIPKGRNQEETVDAVLQRTKEMSRRLQAIKDYEEVQKAKDAREFYLNEIKRNYKKRHAIMVGMDIAAVTMMLAFGKFTGGAIRRAVEENSPFAVQAGRDQERYYRFFVLPNAKNQLMEEREKFEHYQPVPRQNHANTAEDEYLFHQQAMQKDIHLPFSGKMDEKISETMLVQGFSQPEIAEAIDEYSPCRDSQEEYGQRISMRGYSLYNASKQDAEEETRERDVGPVRTREYSDTVVEETEEVTTTTTTTTTVTEETIFAS